MDMTKIHTDNDFSDAVVPEGQVLIFTGMENGKAVTRYKDSSGNFGTIAGNGDNSGNSSSMEFYKCASVDTTAKTWTGYKALLTGGVYSFEEPVTTGLTYGTAYTPAVGKIYSTDAAVFVSSLWSGVPFADLFSADLLSDVSATPTLSMYGNITFGTKAGKQCAIFDGNSCLYNKTWSFRAPFSVSLSLYWESGSEQSILGIGNHQSNNNFELLSKNGVPTIYVMYGADNMELSAASNVTDQWAHIVMTFDGSTRQIYVNKILENSGEVTFTGNQGIVLGSLYGNGTYDSFRDGYMTGGMRYVRVFNKVLTQEEIDQLYAEQV